MLSGRLSGRQQELPRLILSMLATKICKTFPAEPEGMILRRLSRRLRGVMFGARSSRHFAVKYRQLLSSSVVVRRNPLGQKGAIIFFYYTDSEKLLPHRVECPSGGDSQVAPPRAYQQCKVIQLNIVACSLRRRIFGHFQDPRRRVSGHISETD